ncbi:Prophage protein [Lactiplantibacillus plantarum]|nr:Prophage protein [Lactiplantibacillus plantarum]MCG0864516.1 Prophage protein [Lactiplantibacillus plantarum]MCG0908698.1 Prophage protein [Lactiplantibacillus plantarum]
MSQEEFETTQAIITVCFDLVRQGYSLNEIRSGLGNTMSAVGSDNNSAQDLLDEYNRKMKELSDLVDLYCEK